MSRYRSVFIQTLAACCLLMIFGCAQMTCPLHFGKEKVFTIKPFSDNPTNTAVVPVPRNNEEWWVKRQQGVLDRVRQGGVDLILVGDSITHGWDNEPQLWAQYFEPRKAVNMGFGGDRTQHVLWRLDNGSLNGIHPKAAMIMIGTNNSNGQDNTAEEIADGIVAICRDLRTKVPEIKILLLGIFPRGPKPDPQREKNAKASELASKVADGKHIFYMNINDKFLEPDGTLSKEIMPDLLHPNHKGYQIWIDAVNPKLTKLTGK